MSNVKSCQFTCHVKCPVTSHVKYPVMSHVKSCHIPCHLTCHFTWCHVICHMSMTRNVKCPVSHISYHMSHHMPCYMSHVKSCYMSHVMSHVSFLMLTTRQGAVINWYPRAEEASGGRGSMLILRAHIHSPLKQGTKKDRYRGKLGKQYLLKTFCS